MKNLATRIARKGWLTVIPITPLAVFIGLVFF
jgi:ATP/ADP translocase